MNMKACNKLTVSGVGFILFCVWIMFTYEKPNRDVTEDSISEVSTHQDVSEKFIKQTTTSEIQEGHDDQLLSEQHDDVLKWDKWIVVRTVQQPSKQLNILSNIEGWKLLVVGDENTPSDWRLDRALYLDIETQNKLQYKSLSKIPYGLYARKNIGYLYAIQHGAKYIYETNDDNTLLCLEVFNTKGEDYHALMVQTNDLLLNPYAHFGQSSIWPRGFPLQHLGQDQPRTYSLYESKAPVIQQGIVDIDPDIDAIFRLTRKEHNSDINMTFDGGAPAIVLPHQTYSPFNSHNTLFSYDALWAIVLPISGTNDSSDIMRSYWAQKLLELIGYKMVFVPSRTTHAHNSQEYLTEFKGQLDNYFIMGDMCQYLQTWTCKRTVFFDCVRQLTSDLVQANFYQSTDYQLIDSWLQDLQSFGYKQPEMTSQSTVIKPLQVIYYPWEQATCMSNNPSTGLSEYTAHIHHMFTAINQLCNEYLASKYTHDMITTPKYKDILLVISVHDSNLIPYLEVMYKYYFPRILFCGVDDIEEIVNSRAVSYIQVQQVNTVDCVKYAIMMDYKVQSILHITDNHYMKVTPPSINKQESIDRLLQSLPHVTADKTLLNKVKVDQIGKQCEGIDPVLYIVKDYFTEFLSTVDNCNQCNNIISQSYCQLINDNSSDSVQMFDLLSIATSTQVKQDYCEIIDKMIS